MVSEGSLGLSQDTVKEVKYSKMKETDGGFALLPFGKGRACRFI